MPEDTDASQKTEQPTPKRLLDAKKEGKVAFSREVNTFIILVLGTLFIVWLSPQIFKYCITICQEYINSFYFTEADNAVSIQNITNKAVMQFLFLLTVPCLISLLSGILGNVLQNGFLIVENAFKFDLSRISILNGLKRLFSFNSILEMLKSLMKVLCISIAAYIAVKPQLNIIPHIQDWDYLNILTLLLKIIMHMMIGICVAMCFIALLDYMYQYHRYIESLKMTKQEIKDELKQTEGNPEVKGKLRSMRTELAKRRMIAYIPLADIVITNPTHYAVALLYEPNTMNAPKVVAKGVDSLALRIKAIALENSVDVVENIALARLLYTTVEIDDFIKPEHYEAVAKLMHNILRLKGKI